MRIAPRRIRRKWQRVPGVLAADLKLDTFSDFVQAQRPGPHGTVMIFDQAGSLIAHPDFR
jgi:adenylate cyclase